MSCSVGCAALDDESLASLGSSIHPKVSGFFAQILFISLAMNGEVQSFRQMSIMEMCF